jgi:hypothetical protein
MTQHIQTTTGKKGAEASLTFQDADRPAAFVEDGAVGGIDPDVAPRFRDALELGGLMLAGAQLVPELAVPRLIRLTGREEHPVMFPAQFLGRVAEGLKKQRIRLDDAAVRIELDGCVGFKQRVETRTGCGCPQALKGVFHRFLTLSWIRLARTRDAIWNRCS